ncbi:hypothetical protein AVEN_210865-1 [Araneus ventricosus]|uniref:Uncharacterized protein n=1 Tax=Araneus ventricosus TaxID=182803 RepID=A0A4Y2T1H7_ARAVE|nr:hypothetical protein AVEN_210865-1 [Araneus ventricosus]
MGIFIQEDDTIIRHAKTFVSDGFTIVTISFFPKLKKDLPGTRFSSGSDVKTAEENWLDRLGRGFYQAVLNKLAPRSDKCLNRFVYYVEK